MDTDPEEGEDLTESDSDPRKSSDLAVSSPVSELSVLIRVNPW